MGIPNGPGMLPRPAPAGMPPAIHVLPVSPSSRIWLRLPKTASTKAYKEASFKTAGYNRDDSLAGVQSARGHFCDHEMTMMYNADDAQEVGAPAGGAPEAAAGAQGLGRGAVLGAADAEVADPADAAEECAPDMGGEAAPKPPNRDAKGLAAFPAAVGVASCAAFMRGSCTGNCS